jgi:hypothetical protein
MPVVANEPALRCSSATRSLDKLWQRRCKRDEDDALCIIVLQSNGFFFLAILCCSQSGDDPQEDLARSGYKLNMKVKFKEIPSIFLASY